MKRHAQHLTLAVGLCLLGLTVPLGAQEPPAAAPAKPGVQTRESQAAMTPSMALDRLKEGNARFAANATKRRDWSAKVVATTSGQFPHAAILACVVDRAFDGAAVGVPEHDDEPRAHLDGVFEAPELVVVDDVPGYANAKDVTETLVEDDLGGRAGVHEPFCRWARKVQRARRPRCNGG